MPFNPDHYCLLLSFGVISVSGRDAAKFLQGQLTCNINDIPPASSHLAAYCNRQGRVLATLQVFATSEGFLLVLPRSLIPTILATLQSYQFIAKITLSDTSSDYYCYAVFNDTYTQADIIVETTSLPPPFLSESRWKRFLIEQGLVTITPETSGLFTPHKLNLIAFNAVSFSKGCYIGQEIIARTQHLGKHKQHLLQLISDEHCLLPPATPLYAAKEQAALVVNSCLMDKGTHALVVATNLELLELAETQPLTHGHYLFYFSKA